MKILITGSNGFIGKNMINYFKKLGHDVIGMDWPFNWALPWDSIDHVIHCGAISSTTERNADKLYDRNYKFTIELVARCAKNKIPIQYSSSASVYGFGKSPEDFKEGSNNKSPMNGYAWSKFYLDKYMTHLYAEFGTKIQGFRYFNVYGPMEEHKGDQASPVTKFYDQAINQKYIKLFKNSDRYVRDFIHVEDICKVHEKMIGKPSGIYNVGTGITTSFETIALAIADKLGEVEIDYVVMPEELKGQYQDYTCAHTGKLQNLIDMSFKKVEDYINYEL